MNFLLWFKKIGLTRRGSKLLLFYGVATIAFITYGISAYGVDEVTLPILVAFSLITLLLILISILMLIYVEENSEVVANKKTIGTLFLFKSAFGSLVVGFIIFLPSHFIIEFIVGSDAAKFMTENMHEVITILAIIAFPFVYKKME